MFRIRFTKPQDTIWVILRKKIFSKVCQNMNPYTPMSILMYVHGRNLKFYNTLILSYGHTNIKLRVR